MSAHRTRNLVRALVAPALCAALLTSVVVPVPEDLPAFAFKQGSLYRLEVALIVFYGNLLLITPAFAGLIQGRLPIEISARGAKFATGADDSVKLYEEKIEDLKQVTDDLSEGLQAANFEIEHLKKAPNRDNTQPAVGSKG
jgi:hypothetical protein